MHSGVGIIGFCGHSSLYTARNAFAVTELCVPARDNVDNTDSADKQSVLAEVAQ